MINFDNIVTLGLYQHFKGEYVYVDNISMLEPTNTAVVHYFNILHPEYGFFVRPVYEWFTNVSDREDNVTGQSCRFKKILSIDNPAKNLTTEHLIKELRSRSDSIFQSLDIEGLSDKCEYTDYAVCTKYLSGIDTIATFCDKESADTYLRTHQHRKDTKVYKRTFVDIG